MDNVHNYFAYNRQKVQNVTIHFDLVGTQKILQINFQDCSSSTGAHY